MSVESSSDCHPSNAKDAIGGLPVPGVDDAHRSHRFETLNDRSN